MEAGLALFGTAATITLGRHLLVRDRQFAWWTRASLVVGLAAAVAIVIAQWFGSRSRRVLVVFLLAEAELR